MPKVPNQKQLLAGVTAAVESGEVASRMEALGAGVADLVHRYWNWCLVFGVWYLVFGIGI